MLHIIWPDNRFVTDDRMLGWLSDAIANDEVDATEGQTALADRDAHTAALLLDDAGLITLGRDSSFEDYLQASTEDEYYERENNV